MKRATYLAACVCLLTAAGCVREEVVQTEPEVAVSGTYNDDVIEKGWIRIKLLDDAEALPVGAVTRGALASGNEQLDQIAASLGVDEIRRVFADGGKFAERRRKYGFHLWYDLHFDEQTPVSRAADEFGALKELVSYIEPVYKIRSTDVAEVVPDGAIYLPAFGITRADAEMPFNDPMLPQQWHYHNAGGATGFLAGADINAFEAWKLETGKPNVIVSVHDDGANLEHPDLAAHFWVNEAEASGSSKADDDNNGYVDDLHGWSYVNNSGEIDYSSHGTHTSGTISAINNNGIGVCGVAGGTGPEDGVRIMPLQIYPESGTVVNNAPDSYLYAADNGAVISQNSWTLGTTGELPKSYADAFDYFIENAGTDENGNQTGPMKGGIVIFAAGNSKGATSLYPASDPRTISVAAMNPDYTKALYSNYGENVDIFAPGGADSTDPRFTEAGMVYSTSIDMDEQPIYDYKSGTSMACPHVSGVAALIVSSYARRGEVLTAQECKKILLRSFRPVGEAVDEQYYDKLGVGLVDAGLVFTKDSGKQPAAIADASAAALQNRFTLKWTAPADGNDMAVAYYDIAYVGKGVGKREGQPDVEASFQLRNVFEPAQAAAYTWYGLYNVNYTFQVVAVDRFGNRSQAVSMTATSGDYANSKPKLEQALGAISIENVGEEYVRRFDLTQNFSDENLVQGDVLTFSLRNSNEQVVEATIDGNYLIVRPLAKGSARVTVYAIDLDGAGVQTALEVTVENGAAPSPAPEGGAGVYPNPADDTLYVTLDALRNVQTEAVVYDQAARVVMRRSMQFDASGTAALTVADLRPGAYTLVLRQDGATHRMNFMKR